VNVSGPPHRRLFASFCHCGVESKTVRPRRAGQRLVVRADKKLTALIELSHLHHNFWLAKLARVFQDFYVEDQGLNPGEGASSDSRVFQSRQTGEVFGKLRP
jgi:hypothetical protein